MHMEVQGLKQYVLMKIGRKWAKKVRPCMIHHDAPFEVPDLKGTLLYISITFDIAIIPRP